MNRVIFIHCFLLLFSVASFAARDTVIVHKDPRMDLFTARQTAVNKLTAKMTSSGKYRGYRLQMINTRTRENAFKVKSDILQLFPDQKAYILFQSPYFKVRMGNFMHKPDAIAFQEQVSRKFHQITYIVEDIIEYTPKEEEDPALN